MEIAFGHTKVWPRILKFSGPHKTPFQHIHSSLSLSAPPRLTSTRFNEVAKTAEDLAQLLTTTLAELEMRKKESTVSPCNHFLGLASNRPQHIRDILVMKLGIATERNKRLEKQVADLYVHFKVQDSKFTNHLLSLGRRGKATATLIFDIFGSNYKPLK